MPEGASILMNPLNIPDSWGERQRSLSREYGVKHTGGCDISRDLAAASAADEVIAAWKEHRDWKAQVTERNVALGLQGKADLDGLRRRKPPARPAAGTVPVNLLIKHMDEHYSDSMLRNDLDSVLSLCAAERDRKAVREFAKAKLAGKPYTGYGVAILGKVCEACRRPFTARRSTARFCDATCRKRGSRRDTGGHVTLTAPSAAGQRV